MVFAMIAGGCITLAASSATTDDTPVTAGLLEAGETPVTIVCFGDSITGVYYHTGGVRAYPEMLGIALRRLYPRAQLTMVNAGISGNTTAAGLERIERDVLNHRPQLVTVMFGMNDAVGTPIETYRANLRGIVEQCRGIGAEVVLCTPNSVYPEDENRPMERLAAFAQVVRDLCVELDVPLADCWQAYEDIRARDVREWMLLMSETIHPNMNGHKVFAEEIARAISDKRVSLADVPPPTPALSHTLAAAERGESIRVVAMPPFDSLVGDAFAEALPDARVDVVTWPVEGRSLAEIESHAQANVGWLHSQAHPQDAKPQLVVLAVPFDAQASDEERFIRSYSWVLSWSLAFGPKEWDCVAVLPSVTTPDMTGAQQIRLETVRAIVRGQDIPFIDRAEGDRASADELFTRWLESELRVDGGK